MIIEKILQFAKSLLTKAIKDGDIAIDATVGNGHDTLLLAELVGNSGHVYGFDIQQDAINTTLKRLKEIGLQSRVTLYLQGHETVKETLPSETTSIAGAIFNLGYLPGGNKEIVTNSQTTLDAVQQIYSMLKQEGIIVLVIYSGHANGTTERDRLIQYAQQMDQRDAHVLKYEFMNQKNNPPFIIVIEKRTR